jgi:tetratricopeptide (TPR) repeat protein
LGRRLKRAGSPAEASRHFDAALRDERQRGPAALELAECLEEAGKLPEALAEYRLAAEAARRQGQVECLERALSRAGRLAARVKLKRLAARLLVQQLKLDSPPRGDHGPSHRQS